MSQMADPKTQADPGALVCPWCSAAVTAETAVCPSCLAILRSDEEHDVPGVTAVDAAGLLARRPPQRSRFLSWLGGDEVEPAATTSDVQAIARPDVDVQREILRLELVAKISNLQAEADSILSDALVEGRVDDLPDDLRSLAGAEASAETPAETADALVEVAMGRPADAAEQANEPTSPAPTEQSDTPRTADLTDQSAPERPA
jgi:hypothetical protein